MAEDWERDIPSHLSIETFRTAARLKVKAENVGVDIGLPRWRVEKGDSMWYMLTDGERTLIDLDGGNMAAVLRIYVVIVTPHAILTEVIEGAEEVEFSVVGDQDAFVDIIKTVGLRAITDEEFGNYFLGGEL